AAIADDERGDVAHRVFGAMLGRELLTTAEVDGHDVEVDALDREGPTDPPRRGRTPELMQGDSHARQAISPRRERARVLLHEVKESVAYVRIFDLRGALEQGAARFVEGPGAFVDSTRGVERIDVDEAHERLSFVDPAELVEQLFRSRRDVERFGVP